ncbi:MAG: hypothetical protein KKB05_06265 [Proteobacteria bacterium]|nr:hypothetical protein [Pseudomonadota bacterium]MBU4463531.1 hypothetical protein [Pseudomonadota bacterium]
MTYDLEKYRYKREKVLGLKKRGLSFGTLAAIVSFSIIAGLSFVVIPKTVDYMATRNLDDAIYKLENPAVWHDDIIKRILGISGVKKAMTDKNSRRLVVTFDRREVDAIKFSDLFKQKGLKATLLNRLSHRQRLATQSEEEKFEAL